MNDYKDYLMHHGIKGMKWGVRRYQNADGSYTDAGARRYKRFNDKIAKLEGKAALQDSKAENARTGIGKRYRISRAEGYRMRADLARGDRDAKNIFEKLDYKTGMGLGSRIAAEDALARTYDRHAKTRATTYGRIKDESAAYNARQLAKFDRATKANKSPLTRVVRDTYSRSFVPLKTRSGRNTSSKQEGLINALTNGYGGFAMDQVQFYRNRKKYGKYVDPKRNKR